MNARPPERLTATVESLDVQPGDRLLEIGCGRGVAAQLIVQRLAGGELVAVDRSATAVAAAADRNAEAVATGAARFLTMSIAEVDPPALGRFHKVFAVNVNLFWVHPARRELRLISRLLEPGGELVLCYEPPSAEQLDRLRSTLVEHLTAAGYRPATRTRQLARSTLLLVHALPPAP
jgi:cyclopropane fatty-acyl-phospholipid synthase-like methyltransferase